MYISCVIIYRNTLSFNTRNRESLSLTYRGCRYIVIKCFNSLSFRKDAFKKYHTVSNQLCGHIERGDKTFMAVACLSKLRFCRPLLSGFIIPRYINTRCYSVLGNYKSIIQINLFCSILIDPWKIHAYFTSSFLVINLWCAWFKFNLISHKIDTLLHSSVKRMSK